MSDEMFGPRGAAQKILEQAKTRITGQTMKPEAQAKAQERIALAAISEHTNEAAAFCEEVVAWLNTQWNEREFDVEQRIFSLALATINFREHFPVDKGGKEFFDKVCVAAMEYYRSAIS